MEGDHGAATYRVWSGGSWRDVEVPVSGGDPVVVPNIAAIVVRAPDADAILLQRRDKPGEPVRGLLEIPMGRWRAGEDPRSALVREVAEETGLEVVGADVGERRFEAHAGRPFIASRPVVVTTGVEGAYPALNVAYRCLARGEPRPSPGETADPAWYPIPQVRALLADPAAFTGPAYAILAGFLEVAPG